MQKAVNQMADYSLGHSAGEQDRLQNQARYLRGITEAIWRTAGLAPGMRVLDVGCGVGDTSFLAAEIVGRSGTVIGLDRAPAALATARERAAAAGLDQVHFVEGELGTAVGTDFDAVVGRYILIHQPDVSAALRRLRPLLRPGGLLAFHEVELDLRAETDPAAELAVQVRSWVRTALRLGGVQPHAVTQLARYFFEAGLGWPQIQLHPLVSCGEHGFGPGYLVQTLRTLAPLLYRHGVVSAEQLDLDTLEDRLRAACRNGAPAMVQINGGAWARTAGN